MELKDSILHDCDVNREGGWEEIYGTCASFKGVYRFFFVIMKNRSDYSDYYSSSHYCARHVNIFETRVCLVWKPSVIECQYSIWRNEWVPVLVAYQT